METTQLDFRSILIFTLFHHLSPFFSVIITVHEDGPFLASKKKDMKGMELDLGILGWGREGTGF